MTLYKMSLLIPRWHHLLLEHQGRDVTITLDDEPERMSADYDHPHLHLPQTVYFGGMEVVSQAAG